jgi:DNA-binding response OmpR family regulator
MAERILVLEPDATTARALREAGYDVTAASTTDQAVDLLLESPPDVVIIEARAGTFSGLPLLRHPSKLPRVATIVVSQQPEPFIEAEARRHQAMYLVKPADPQVLVAVVAVQAAAARHQRRWPRWPATGRLAAVVGHKPAVLLDVSYDGLRFEVPQEHADSLTTPVDIRLVDRELEVAAAPVWRHRTPWGAVRVGARLLQPDRGQMIAWRDAVNGVAAVA